jgi:hypothetical protein
LGPHSRRSAQRGAFIRYVEWTVPVRSLPAASHPAKQSGWPSPSRGTCTLGSWGRCARSGHSWSRCARHLSPVSTQASIHGSRRGPFRSWRTSSARGQRGSQGDRKLFFIYFWKTYILTPTGLRARRALIVLTPRQGRSSEAFNSHTLTL